MRVKELLKNISIVFLFFIYSFFLLLQSPLNLWSNDYTAVDSSVFIYVGRTILNGGVPYVDVFDHKGPILYFLNALGLMIHSEYGIWILEIVFLTITLVIAYKIGCRVSKSSFSAVLTVLVVFSLLADCLEGGNFTEEYSLLFQTIALYYFCDFFFSGKIVRWRILLVGICFALTALTRLNLVAGWIPFCIYIFCKLLWKKDISGIKLCLGYFGLGVFFVCAPVFLYLAVKGAISLFWHDYIVFNFGYLSRNGMENLKECLLYFSNNPIVWLSFVLGVFMIVHAAGKKDRNLVIFEIGIVNFVCWLLSFWIIVSPGNLYRHYLICLLPYMILSMAYAIAFVCYKYKKLFVKILIVVCALLMVSPMCFVTIRKFRATKVQEDTRLTDYLNENMENDDELLVLVGINCWIYNETDSFSSSRYPYFVFSSIQDMKEEYIEDMQTNMPEYIVTYIKPDSLFQTVSEHYKQVFATGDFLVFEKIGK